MKILLLTLGAVILLITGAWAQTDQELYCERYGISDWCSRQGMEFLQSLTPEQLANIGYLNDLVFSDAAIYRGDLRITRIDVIADLTDPSQTDASYAILNPSDSDVTVHIVALEAPEGTKLYLDGQLIDKDAELQGVNVTFAPGQEREIRLVFSEPLYGDIFGYNVNLLFDYQIVAGMVTPLGNYKFILPANAVANCTPADYTTVVENGRPVVIWQKTDFSPWTNPFNDLVCAWAISEVPSQPPAQPPEKPADYTLLIILIVLLVVVAALLYLKKIGKLARKQTSAQSKSKTK